MYSPDYGRLIESLLVIDLTTIISALASRRVLFAIQLSLITATLATGLASSSHYPGLLSRASLSRREA